MNIKGITVYIKLNLKTITTTTEQEHKVHECFLSKALMRFMLKYVMTFYFEILNVINQLT